MNPDPAYARRFVEWKNAQGIRTECPMCRTHNDWELQDLIVTPPVRRGGVHITGSLPPLLQVVCRQCAFVLHFAATPMGISLPRRSDSSKC
jgi:hypothetical protein